MEKNYQQGWTYKEMYSKIYDYKNLPDVENSKNLVISFNEFIRIIEEKFEDLKKIQEYSDYLKNLAEEITFDQKSYNIVSARKSLLSESKRKKMLLSNIKQIINEKKLRYDGKRLICFNIDCIIVNNNTLRIDFRKVRQKYKNRIFGRTSTVSLFRDIGSEDIYFRDDIDNNLISYNLNTITYLFDLMEEYLQFFPGLDKFVKRSPFSNSCQIKDDFFDIEVKVYSTGEVKTNIRLLPEIDPDDIFTRQYITGANLSKIVTENLSEIGEKIVVNVRTLEEPFKSIVIESKNKEYKLEKIK